MFAQPPTSFRSHLEASNWHLVKNETKHQKSQNNSKTHGKPMILAKSMVLHWFCCYFVIFDVFPMVFAAFAVFAGFWVPGRIWDSPRTAFSGMVPPGPPSPPKINKNNKKWTFSEPVCTGLLFLNFQKSGPKSDQVTAPKMRFTFDINDFKVKCLIPKLSALTDRTDRQTRDEH